jgi:hypothetical protein
VLQHVTITIKVPVLNLGTSAQAVGGVQHILNDFARFNGEETLLHENWNLESGSETEARIRRFQQENGIAPATGGVGLRTWAALLQAWLPLKEAG